MAGGAAIDGGVIQLKWDGRNVKNY
jgi:hypothetical protein